METNILVTGGTGLVGAHLLFSLVKKGEKPIAVHRQNSDLNFIKKVFSFYDENADALFDKIMFKEADLLDVVSLGEAMQGVSQVYHCAAIVSFAPQEADKMMEENPLMTENVVNAALANGVEKLVHCSSVAALGRANPILKGAEKKASPKIITEKTEWKEGEENSAYAKSKYLAELQVWRGIEEGLNAAIVNPSIILGAGNWDSGSSALFKKIANGFKFYTDGINGYVDVRDVAKAMILLMESDVSGERFILNAANKSYREIFTEIAKNLNAKPPQTEAKKWMSEIIWRLEAARTFVFGGNPLVTKSTARTAFQTNIYANEKIRKMLGFEFRDIQKSIAEISRFYQEDDSAKKNEGELKKF